MEGRPAVLCAPAGMGWAGRLVVETEPLQLALGCGKSTLASQLIDNVSSYVIVD